ncbi:MAG: hypothetical protein WC964_00795 [Acholeplasmataceae bacterium]
MAIIKYFYLLGAYTLYGYVNYVSYTNPAYQANLTTKIIFSTVSLLLLIGFTLIILIPEKIIRRPFSSFSRYTRVVIYIGVYIAPLISLYY